MTASHRWEERRRLRHLERRRRRGGVLRGPVVLQRAAHRIRGGTRLLSQGLRRAIRGDRPLILALLGVVALGVVIVSSPLQSYLDGRARVAHLSAQADALDEANAELTQRTEDLERDTTIELLAREQLGLVRPGEVAYALSPPEVDRPRITPSRQTPAPEERPWYVRLWDEAWDRLGG
ncbi:MAG: septum formation initiator family protein [Nitriliruptoraceae bacterium]